jgi:hypothetical protein
MRKFFLLFVTITALCTISFAQRKTAPKPTKQTNPSTKSENKSGAIDDTMFFITVEHNGEKTELKYTQFEEHGGTATLETGKGRIIFFYGASNSVKNDKDFEFVGMISAAAKGTYQFGTTGTMFSFKADEFPNVPMFMCKSGNYEITAMPLAGGFVEGRFSAACENVTNDGEVENYNLRGSFKLLRMY